MSVATTVDEQEMIDGAVRYIDLLAENTTHWLGAWLIHDRHGDLLVWFLHDESFHAVH